MCSTTANPVQYSIVLKQCRVRSCTVLTQIFKGVILQYCTVWCTLQQYNQTPMLNYLPNSSMPVYISRPTYYLTIQTLKISSEVENVPAFVCFLQLLCIGSRGFCTLDVIIFYAYTAKCNEHGRRTRNFLES